MAEYGENKLFDKIMDFLLELHDDEMIYIPNGTTGLCVAEDVYNILKKYSTSKEERKSDDMNIPKPAELMSEVLKGFIKDGVKHG